MKGKGKENRKIKESAYIINTIGLKQLRQNKTTAGYIKTSDGIRMSLKEGYRCVYT